MHSLTQPLIVGCCFPDGEGLRHPWLLRECLPGACPARYFCIKYLISSPRFILTLEVLQVDPTRPQTFSARHLL